MTIATILATQNLPAIGTHWAEQGGHFAGLLRGTPGRPDRAIIVAPEHLEIKGQWGKYGQKVPDAASHTDGLANTRAMAASSSQIAIDVLAIRDDHSDWAIPSAGALVICRANVPEVFAQDWYWSSTQHVSSNAIAQHFADGNSNWYNKDYQLLVRPVRTIQLQPFTA